MYLTAGCAMEALTNKNWETLVSERIIKPLGMSRTSFSIADMQKEANYSFPYIERDETLKKMMWLWRGSCYFSHGSGNAVKL